MFEAHKCYHKSKDVFFIYLDDCRLINHTMRLFKGKTTYNQQNLSVSNNEKDSTLITEQSANQKNETAGTHNSNESNIDVENKTKEKTTKNVQNIKEKREIVAGVQQMDKNGKCKFKNTRRNT